MITNEFDLPDLLNLNFYADLADLADFIYILIFRKFSLKGFKSII
ncbi:hypothetical protein J2W48_002269 [Flavobacterium piscis]|uniref:Uncharacterized protein n=1 Tax=Flavobacterium piscis TaxID=1114874 RepID=A0ABU1Y7V2_9FLAO|nr:hypothetical protein [Flavobacterium piscis]